MVFVSVQVRYLRVLLVVQNKKKFLKSACMRMDHVVKRLNERKRKNFNSRKREKKQKKIVRKSR